MGVSVVWYMFPSSLESGFQLFVYVVDMVLAMVVYDVLEVLNPHV